MSSLAMPYDDIRLLIRSFSILFILINWSMEPEGAASPKEPLKAFVRQATPPPQAPAPRIDQPPAKSSFLEPLPPKPPEPQPPTSPVLANAAAASEIAVVPAITKRPFPWWWLLWLLLAFLLGMIVRSCAAPTLETEVRRADGLTEEVAHLEQEVLAAPPCTAPAKTQAACSTQQAEGSDAPETRTIELGQTSGMFQFVYDTVTNPDQMVVSYEGRTLFDTGCVSTCQPAPPNCLISGGPCRQCGKEEVKTKDLSYSGKSSTVTVQVFPNCTGLSGTKWQFLVSCPQLKNK